jgi:OPA family glycerol-3-phosphate transporter-like MFS transporter
VKGRLGQVEKEVESGGAIGTAAGFIGLFGYIGRTTQAIGFGSITQHMGASHGAHAAWNLVLWLLVGCGVL